MINVKIEKAWSCLESVQPLRLGSTLLKRKQNIVLILNINAFGGNGEGRKVYSLQFRLCKFNLLREFHCSVLTKLI